MGLVLYGHVSPRSWFDVILFIFFVHPDVLDEDKFSVELVVQCIRATDVPQTHHHALLLLGAVANIFPVSRLDFIFFIFFGWGGDRLTSEQN